MQNAKKVQRVAWCLACFLFFPGLVFGLVACGDKKKPTDAGVSTSSTNKTDAASSEDADAEVFVDAAGPEAANELEIARYEDESEIDQVGLVVKTPFANVYRAFPKGDLVTSLKTGYGVVAVAERNGYYRVIFDAPYPPERKLMGWVPHYVFEDLMAAAIRAAADAGADGGAPLDAGAKRALHCFEEQSQVLVLQDLVHRDPHCAYGCKDDLECKQASATCEVAILLGPSGSVGSTPQYATVCTDAGAPTTVKRKVPSLFGIPHRSDGKCPPNFIPAPKTGTLCYRGCKTDADCPEYARCQLTPAKDAKLCHVVN